jgi:DNA-binding transcriptional LysR family regulator
MIVRRLCEGLPEISRYFTNRDVRPSFSFRTTNDDRAMSMVAAGLGITVAPSSFRRPGLAHVKLIGLDLHRDIGLAYSDRVREQGEASGFAAAVRATYAPKSDPMRSKRR